MQTAYRLFSAGALALLSSASSFAATTVYTTSSSFMSNVAAGSYTETFTGLSDPATSGPVAFLGGGFGYSASSPVGIYVSAGFLGTNLPNGALTLTFTSGAVKAVGANFYTSNFSDQFQSVVVTLTLNDGTSTTFTPTSIVDSYRGFVSTAAITSLVISSPGVSLYAGLDNLTVGAAAPVPEPASWLLMGLGVAGLLAARRRTA